MGAALKARYIKGMIGTMPSFLSMAFGWLCPRPASLLARLSRSLLVLLNAGHCECLWRDLAQ